MLSEYSVAPLMEWLTWQIILAIVLCLAAVLYWLALPRPLKGIPYNRRSAWTPMGDFSTVMSYYKKTNTISPWFCQHCIDLKAPVAQVLMMRTPIVIVADHTECEDILSRRFREFDRIDMTGDLMGGIIPRATISMPSSDHFRAQRRLWAGTMSNSFLNDVAGPQIHASAKQLIELWQKKAELSSGHPFQADLNLKQTTMDIIWNITTGHELNGLQSQIEKINTIESIELPSDTDQEAMIPEGSFNDLFNAVQTMINRMVEIGMKPFAGTRFYLERHLSKTYRRANKVQRETISRLLQEAKANFEGHSGDDRKPVSAIEQVLGKELKVLEKSGTAVGADDDSMHDEVFMFLVAGFETTSTTMSWALKFLSDNQDSQTRLRNAIRKTFPQSVDGVIPSVEEITKSDIPYLDASLSEILRVAQTASGVGRIASEGTFVLGHWIPAGTVVICGTKTEEIMRQKHRIDESQRSDTGKHVETRYGDWNIENRDMYIPDRWLEKNDAGEEVFNANMGPSLPFAAGPRGCFGRKLAMMELRGLIVALVMNFEFQKVPDQLGGYEAKEIMTRQPAKCFIRVKTL